MSSDDEKTDDTVDKISDEDESGADDTEENAGAENRADAILKIRENAKLSLEQQKTRMLKFSNRKFPPAQVGDTVKLRIPDVDRGRGIQIFIQISKFKYF